MNSGFPWTPQWNAEAKLLLAFHGSFSVTPTPGPSCLLNSASLNNPISCTSWREEAKLLPKGLSASSTVLGTWSHWMNRWFLDWLAWLEYKALALLQVEWYTLSQKKKERNGTDDSARKLSLNTIIPPPQNTRSVFPPGHSCTLHARVYWFINEHLWETTRNSQKWPNT